MKTFCAVAVSLVLAAAAAQDPSPAAIRATFAEAVAAHNAKEYPRYLEKMQALAALRPTHPTILYNLASAFALNDRLADAAATLERLVALNLSFDPGADPDFDKAKT